MILLALMMNLAQADIAPRSDPGMTFLEHQLAVDGLEAHPDFVLVIHPKPRDGEITTHRALSMEGSNQTVLFNARSPSSGGGDIHTPQAQLMSRALYEGWNADRIQRTRAQEEECEQGKGCVHISRFIPHFPAPTEGSNCTMGLTELPSQAPQGSLNLVTHRVQLQLTEEGACTLVSQPITVPEAAEEGLFSLSPASGLAGLLVGLLLLLRGRQTD